MMNTSQKTYTVDDREFWENMYQTGKTPWELGAPSPPLVTFVKSPYMVPAGKMAVLGCGTGSDCVLFASQKLEVTGIDFAPTAIQRTLAKFEQAGISGKTGFLLERDVFNLHDYDGYYDYVLEHCFLPSLHPSRRRTYVYTVRDLLKPGGKLIALWWLTEIPPAFGPPFSFGKDELYKLFDPFFKIDIAYVPTDSVPARKGAELLTVMTRRD
jgi:SAM-dependent methyltransferase